MSTEQSSNNTNFVRPVAVPETPASALVASEVRMAEKLVDQPREEAPIDLYREQWDRPYISDLLGMAGLEKDYQEHLDVVDKYIISQIQDRQLKPSKDSYKSVLAEIELKLSLDPNLNYDAKLSKLSSYITLINQQNRIELTKKLLEYGTTDK